MRQGSREQRQVDSTSTSAAAVSALHRAAWTALTGRRFGKSSPSPVGDALPCKLVASQIHSLGPQHRPLAEICQNRKLAASPDLRELALHEFDTDQLCLCFFCSLTTHTFVAFSAGAAATFFALIPFIAGAAAPFFAFILAGGAPAAALSADVAAALPGHNSVSAARWLWQLRLRRLEVSPATAWAVAAPPRRAPPARAPGGAPPPCPRPATGAEPAPQEAGVAPPP